MLDPLDRACTETLDTPKVKTLVGLRDEYQGKPTALECKDSLDFNFKKLGLAVRAERIKDDGSAELQFLSSNTNGDTLLLRARVNLLSAPAMSSLSKRLKASLNIEWTGILTHITGKTIEHVRKGSPAEKIWPSEDVILTPEYLLEPILYANHPAVIFGEYASTKSLFGLVVAAVCQLPYFDNTLGLIAPEEPTPCLYLDYEDDSSSFSKRWGALLKGLNVAAMPISYKSMTATLADSVEQLQKIIAEDKIRLLIVDSLGPAARGNLNDPEPAIKYHAALRQLGITSLTLAHTAKDAIAKKRTIFGSVFFTNLVRSVWECKAEQDIGEDETVISLKHTKANLSRLHPPLGYKFTFTDNSISITRTDLRDTGLSGELPLTWQIKSLLEKAHLQ
ncbi:AAA family ATPase [Chloroflexota bacterium]